MGPKRKRTNKREEPQTLFAGESAESIIRMVKAARQEGGEDKPEDNNGPEREYQPPDIEDPWDMSGVIQRLALSEAPGTTRPGEDAGRVEPRVDDPALPAPSGGETRGGGAGGLRETAASTAPGNTRPDEDVGRVGPRQLDAATSQAPMEEEPDWSCDNQSEDGCLLSHAPTEAMQITEGSSPTKGGQAPEARKEPEEWAQCNNGDKWPRSGEEQDWANDAQSVDDSVHPSIATALESVTTGTSIKGLLLGGRAKQPRTQVESRKEHSADVVRPKAVQLSGREHRTRSEERVREGAGHSHSAVSHSAVSLLGHDAGSRLGVRFPLVGAFSLQPVSRRGAS